MSAPHDLHHRVCNLCEAMCGLEIEHIGERVLRVRGDENDPFSKGAICPKGALITEVYEDPDRLRRPLKKTTGGFEEIGWDEAFDLVERGINRIREAQGRDSVALYTGNPTVHNLGSMLYAGHLRRALGSKNNFSPTSMDQLPHHFASHYMFGHSMLVPIPDIDRTDYMLILGANPLASQGSIMSAPGVGRRLKAIVARGGKWVVLDPRATETAQRASEHHFIRPATDVFFLLALLHVLCDEKRVRLGPLEQHVTGLNEVLRIAQSYSPEAVEGRTGVPASAIRRIAGEYLAADRAVVYGRMGVCTQPHGGLNIWLINLLNILSGHFDRPGGAMFTTPAADVIRRKTGRKQGRFTSRVRGFAEFDGELPVSVMAEEMLTAGEGQVRGLVTLCGNPVLSSPNGTRLDQALAGLEFMVSIDIYLNETTRHADVILPPTTGLEIDHYDLVFNTFAVSNVAKFSPELAPRAADRRHDWEILKELVTRFSKKKPGLFFRWGTPRRLLNIALLTGPYGKLSSWRRLASGLSLRKVQESVHGVDLGPLQPRLPQGLRNVEQKVHLAPSVFTDHLDRLRVEFEAEPIVLSANQVQLIGRRHLRDNNSWMHNAPKLMKGSPRCTLQLHPTDAGRLGIEGDQMVRVKSRTGSISLPVEVTEGIMPGVASIPHGYGHTREGTRQSVAAQHGAVSVNDITDTELLDPVTKNAAFSAQVVTIESA